MDEYDEESLEFYEENEDLYNSSLFSVRESGSYNFNTKIFGNTSLKVGIISKVLELDDEDNISKKVPEYNVLILEENEQEAPEVRTYKNCLKFDSFGGKFNFFDVKLKANEESLLKNDGTVNINFKDQSGDMVLLLCLNGSVDKGIIINSFSHPGRKSALTKEAGDHLEGEYNGLNWKVNKDGELTVTFNSKRDKDGKPKDETAGGTTLKMDKEGSVDINTNLEGDEETYMRIDKKNKDIGLKAGANVGFTAKKDVAMNADGKITGKAKGSVEFAAEGTAKLSAKSSLTLEGESAVNVKGGNVIISGQNGVIIEGQQCMIDTQKVFVGQGGTPAVIATTKFVGQGNHGAPVNCSAVGPFSSSVFIAS